MAVDAKVTRPRRPWRILILVAILGACIAVLAWYRTIAGVQILTASAEQVQTITGRDLAWSPPGDDHLVASSELVEVAAEVDAALFRDSVSDPAAQRATQERAERAGQRLQRVVERGALRVPPPDEAGGPEALRAKLGSEFKEYAAWMKLANLLSLHVAHAMEARDNARTFDAVTAGLDYQDFFRRSRMTSMVDYRVRAAIQSILFSAVDRAARSGLLSVEQLEAVYRRIPPAPADDRAVASTYVFEWNHVCVPFLTGIRSKEDLTGPGDTTGVEFAELMSRPTDSGELVCGQLDVPATLAKIASLFRLRIQNCSRGWNEQDASVDEELKLLAKKIVPEPQFSEDDGWLERVTAKIAYRQKMAAQTNSLGLKFIHAFTSINPMEVSFRTRTQAEALRMTLALAKFKKQTGSAPQALDQLRATVTSEEFPRDLYAQAGFRYDLGRGVFWSVGPNGTDDGGRDHPRKINGADLVWLVP